MTYKLAVDSWGPEEHEAALGVLRSGQVTMSTEVRNFEEEFADKVGSAYAVMVNSGSSANLLMAWALRYAGLVEPGAPVVVPALGWSTTYFPFLQAGFELVFADVDRGTFVLGRERAQEACAAFGANCVVGVSVLGHPWEFAPEAGGATVVIEDSCEHLELGTHHGSKHPLMRSFSTYFSHHLSTGEGGLVVTNDEGLFRLLVQLRAHGWTRDLPGPLRTPRDGGIVDFHGSFSFEVPGFNVRPTEIAGAVGRVQLRRAEKFAEARASNATSLGRLLGDFKWLTMQRSHPQHSWFGFGLIVGRDAPLSRDELAKKLTRAGIECRPVIAGNMSEQPVFKRAWPGHRVHVAGPLAMADEIHERGIMIGNHHVEMSAELEQLQRVLTEVEM